MFIEIWTIKKVLAWTEEYFFSHKIETPRLDAELLLSHVLKCSRVELYTRHQHPLSLDERNCFKELVRRRTNHEPVAYLLKKKDFYQQSLVVNDTVLIPRPETEFLVDDVLQWCKQNQRLGSTVDIIEVGTGSGNIAIALGLEIPGANIVTIEVCDKAANIARQNIRTYGLEKQVSLVVDDYKEYLFGKRNLGLKNRFDIFISNPPYIALDDNNVMESTRCFEPHKALFAGQDGLSFYRDFAELAPDLLNNNGALFLEIGIGQKDKIVEIFQQENKMELEKITKDYQGIERVLSWIRC